MAEGIDGAGDPGPAEAVEEPSDPPALERWARDRPDEPVLFYRGTRGQFQWLSHSQAVKVAQRGADDPLRRSLPLDLVATLVFLESVESSSEAPLAEEMGSPVGGRRDVWISWRSPEDARERALLAWALKSGAAILVELSGAFPGALAEWARPTILSGPAAEIDGWFDALERASPRWGRRRWLRRRLERLRRIVVDTPADEGARRGLEARLRALAPESRAAVVTNLDAALV